MPSALTLSIRYWAAVTALGQLAFAVYVLGVYLMPTLRGEFDAWNRVLPHGHMAGDPVGNGILAIHLLLPGLFYLSGWLQLWGALRARYPQWHRWSGRFFMVSALVLSLGGIALVLRRGVVGGTPAALGIGLDGVLICLFAVLAWRSARARNFVQHRRWALRLFVAAGGVWFFRVGLMLWLMIFQAPVGFDPKSFTGPFLTVLNFACYLLPLALLEWVLWAQQSRKPNAQRAAALGLAVATTLMAGGIVAATLGMWLPRLQ